MYAVWCLCKADFYSVLWCVYDISVQPDIPCCPMCIVALVMSVWFVHTVTDRKII